MEEDLSIDFMDTPPEQQPLRASLPPNNPKIKPNHHNPINNKRESKPTDLMTVVNTLRTTTNPPLKGRTTTTKDNTHRRKPSVGSKTENPIVVFGKPSLNGKERSRLADLTNQVKS